MDIENMTLKELREINNIFKTNQGSHSIKVGAKYLIRTVTYFYTGQVESITDSDIVLSSAAWIADTGRFADAVKTGNFNEVEPYPDRVIIQRAGIIDMVEVDFELPRLQK